MSTMWLWCSRGTGISDIDAYCESKSSSDIKHLCISKYPRVKDISEQKTMQEQLMTAPNTTNKRLANIDVLKTLALLCVIGVHFFFNAGFNDTNLNDAPALEGYFAMFLRNACSICVPIFLIASGFLLRNKKITAVYFAGILKIIIVYIGVCIITCLYRIYFMHESFTFLDGIWMSTGFWGNKYAWYVEMYLGLFLIAPFLNAMFDGLGTRRNRTAFLVVMLIVVMLPSQVNFAEPILPDWWTDRFFPVMYYYLGVYMREYKPRLCPAQCFGAYAVWVAACALFNYAVCMTMQGGVFGWREYTDWDSIQNVLASYFIFAAFQQMKMERMPKRVAGLFRHLAESTLAAYLLSWLFDNALYPLMMEAAGGGFFGLFLYYIPVVLSLFVCAMAAGVVCTLICNAVSKPLIGCLRKKISDPLHT